MTAESRHERSPATVVPPPLSRFAWATLVVAGLSVLASPATSGAGGKIEAGAYCPLPERGQKPVCLTPAEAEYETFFAELADVGQPSDASARRVERDLLSSTGDDYLALSSISYGYYRMAQTAAAAPNPDPMLVARLESWNELLSSAYERTGADPAFREAVRRAAEDIHEKAPTVGAGDGTSATLVDALARIDDPGAKHGVRGALARLFGRLLGEEAR